MGASLLTRPAASVPAMPLAPTPSVPQREVRMLTSEIRSEVISGQKYLTGYAAVFNSLSADLGGWREMIRPGAFSRCLATKREIRHLVNHDGKQLLGSTLSGTTEIWEDEIGLRFRTLCSDRSYELDLLKSVERGDAKRCSFAFIVVDKKKGQKWSRPANEAYDLRELLDLDVLEVSSLTTAPAYAETSMEVIMRSMFPDGVPAELRDRMQAMVDAGAALDTEESDELDEPDGVDADAGASVAATADAADGTDAAATECACACESCVAGNCSNCTNTECVDPMCNCGQGKDDGDGDEQMKAKLAVEAAAAAAIQAAAALPTPTAIPVPTRSPVPSLSSEYMPKLPLSDRRGIHANFKRIRNKILARQHDIATREERGLEFRSSVDPVTKELVLYMYGDIGEDYCGDGISSGTIRRAVEAAGDFDSIRGRINSPGGDAFEGVTIGNYLRSLKKPITMCVDGLAASAASVIAMCGHRLEMAPNSMLMCHNASCGAYGFADDLRKMADVLEVISTSIAQTYVGKTGKKLAEIKTILAAETWMGAEDAVAEGFADAVVDPGADSEMPTTKKEKRALAMLADSRLLATYQNLPEGFMESITSAAMEIRELRAAAASAAAEVAEVPPVGTPSEAPLAALDAPIDPAVLPVDVEETERLQLRIRLAKARL